MSYLSIKELNLHAVEIHKNQILYITDIYQTYGLCLPSEIKDFEIESTYYKVYLRGDCIPLLISLDSHLDQKTSSYYPMIHRGPHGHFITLGKSKITYDILDRVRSNHFQTPIHLNINQLKTHTKGISPLIFIYGPR